MTVLGWYLFIAFVIGVGLGHAKGFDSGYKDAKAQPKPKKDFKYKVKFKYPKTGFFGNTIRSSKYYGGGLETSFLLVTSKEKKEWSLEIVLLGFGFRLYKVKV